MSGKILITGGFGNLGSYITKYLVGAGYELYILTRKEKHRFENLHYTVVECDITDKSSLEKNLNFEIDFCIHLASFNEFFLPNYPPKALEINSYGTRNLLEVLSQKNLKNFIYFSTFHVYGKNSGFIDETTPLTPINDYALTHLFAEYYIQQFSRTHNVPYTILRLTNSYGSPSFVDTDKWYLVLNDLVKSAFETEKIILKSNGKAKRDFISMQDVSDVVFKLFQIKATNEIYNLSSKKTYEILDLVKKVQIVFQDRYKKEIEYIINKNDKTIYKDLCVDNGKIKQLIDFKVCDIMSQEINNICSLLEKQH